MEFSENVLKNYFKEVGASRVSKEAVIVFGKVLETFAGDIAEEALFRAEKEGRKTVFLRDVLSAISGK